MIDDWIIELEEHGVVAEAVNPPLVEYAWPNEAGVFLEHEAAIAINVRTPHALYCMWFDVMVWSIWYVRMSIK